MQFKTESNIVIVRLDDGEDFFESMEKVVKSCEIESGMILSGIGQLKNFELGYFDGEKYVKKTFEKPMELVSMHGSIAETFHIHCTLADEKQRVYGGHLFKGIVSVVNELMILKLNKIRLKREKDKKTGLKTLEIR
ncbi:MAG: DNA-binding protein [Candidatus Thermoplasmatota archaeon]|nr:DNA-binding protein [Candidatus Thermoplasmatota archaeon]